MADILHLVAAGVPATVVRRIRLRYEPPVERRVPAWHVRRRQPLPWPNRRTCPSSSAIGANESWVALAAWAVTFVAMLAHLARPPGPTSGVS